MAGFFKLGPTALMNKRSGYRDQRAPAMEMMYRYSGIKQVGIDICPRLE